MRRRDIILEEWWWSWHLFDGKYRSASRGLACQGAGRLASHSLILAFPFSWMNQSGPVVANLLAELGIDSEKLVVVQDDLDLSFGVLRIKLQGGAGGHNGIHSLIASLETDRFFTV